MKPKFFQFWVMKTILLGVSILVCQILFKRIFQPRKNHGWHFCISTFDLFLQRSSFKFAIQKRLGDKKWCLQLQKRGSLSLALYLHTYIYIYICIERERCIYIYIRINITVANQNSMWKCFFQMLSSAYLGLPRVGKHTNLQVERHVMYDVYHIDM